MYSGFWCIIGVRGVGALCEQGGQHESQLAAVQLGASQGSAMQAGTERALQPVLGHMCSCLMQAAVAWPALCLLLLSSYAFGSTLCLGK